MGAKPPTLVAVAVTAAANGLGPRPSAFVLTMRFAGPAPPLGLSHTCTTAPFGAIAISPKLQPAVPGIFWSGPKAPMFAAPKPVTAAPRATIEPAWFQTTQTSPESAVTVGWST